MASYYTVRQGEHLSRIARECGFSDYLTIWNHPANADLKQKRQNPNVLAPGDSLYIPERENRVQDCPTDAKHQFRMKQPVLRLRLTLEDVYMAPIANAQCELVLESEVRNLTTDSNGRLETFLSPSVHEGTLTILDADSPFSGLSIPIRVGDLDPVDQRSGQQARLNNLGYDAGPAGGADDDQFCMAVEEFQCEHGLQVDGICGPLTQVALKKAHGC
jgi:N-acetylmuramoyl-L-alanine amidase